MSVSPYHSKTTGNDAVHPAFYFGTSDPASPDTSVTADNKIWVDQTTGTTLANGWQLKIRAASNTVWTTILDLATTLALKANLASPTFTGVPAAPTAAPGTNTTQIATTAFVAAAGAGVSSVFGRSGAVTAQSGDYTVAQVTNAAATTGNLSQFASTTSAQLATLLSDETGSGGGFVRATGPTLSGPLGIVENDIGASTHDAGNTSTAITVDWSVARTQKVTATGSATVTHSNMVAGLVYTLEYYTGAGSFTATFASTNFAGGTAPTLTVTASKVDVFTFYKTIGGTIFGGIFGQSFAP